MTTELFLDRLTSAASLEGPDGAIRITATYEPASGPGTKVSPPTYPRDSTNNDSPYVIEERVGADGSRSQCVLLDSRQSQANRCEAALEEAMDKGKVRLPHLVLDVETHGSALRFTSLSAPHRSRDAYFRDSVAADGTRFDTTSVGKALDEGDAAAFYTHSPADLVYGVWDSHRDRRVATKFPRVYTSEVVGEDAEIGLRVAGRYDLHTGAAKVKGGNMDWELTEKGGQRVSEIGLGPIPPVPGPGGATTRTVRREGSVSFAGLSRLPVGEGKAGRAGRAVLAALALLGDRLAFGTPAIFLRSGCDLVLREEQLAWVGRSDEEPFELTIDDAVSLFETAVGRATAAGLAWDAEPLRLVPMEKLQALIDRVYFTAPEEDE